MHIKNHHSDVILIQVLLVRQIPIERDKYRKGGLYSRLQKFIVVVVRPPEVLCGVYLTVLRKLAAQAMGNIVIQ
jgi:hypothetical protein